MIGLIAARVLCGDNSIHLNAGIGQGRGSDILICVGQHDALGILAQLLDRLHRVGECLPVRHGLREGNAVLLGKIKAEFLAGEGHGILKDLAVGPVGLDVLELHLFPALLNLIRRGAGDALGGHKIREILPDFPLPVNQGAVYVKGNCLGNQPLLFHKKTPFHIQLALAMVILYNGFI